MKLSGFIFALLFMQVYSAFFDNFRSAMSNVEHGFSKLLTDVVTDVKDTIHCTISAVEQVLVLNGLLDKTSSYSYSCRGLSKPIQPPLPKVRDQRSLLEDFQRLKYSNHALDYHNLPIHTSIDLGKSIANVNKTINDILGQRKANSNLKLVSETMKEETDRLIEVSKILKQELDHLSSNIKIEIQKLLFDRQESNFESIWDEIKTLHNIQQRSANDTEINEIRHILGKVIDTLRLKSDKQKQFDGYNLKEIRKTLEGYSNINNKHNQKDIEEHSRLKDLSFKQPNKNNAPKTFKDVAIKIFNQEKKNPNSKPSNSEKSLFNLNLNSVDYLTPFSTTDRISEKTISDAKKIIEDSQHTDKVLNNFFNAHRSAPSVFSNPDLFNFGKS